MIHKLQMLAREGNLQVTHLYVAHIKRVDEQNTLMRSEATDTAEKLPFLWPLFTKCLYQAIEGELNDTLFYSWYTGDILSVAKVASDSYDRTMNKPSVDVLETIRDIQTFSEQQMVAEGNLLAYKVMASGKISNHLLGLLRFTVTPSLGAEPIPFVFACLVDLEDKEEINFDANQGIFVTRELNDVVKRTAISRGVFFPALDDNLQKEQADLLVYTKSAAIPWFKALDATPRFSLKREATCLLKNLAQVAGEEIPPTLLQTMAAELKDHAADGIPCEAFTDALEKALGHGVDRLAIAAKWEKDFKSPQYRPRYESLFHGKHVEKPAKLKFKGDAAEISVNPRHLADMRVVALNGRFYTVLRLNAATKLNLGKDLTLALSPITPSELTEWMASSPADGEGDEAHPDQDASVKG